MRKFKTESKKLLNLMVNSIYTNKEIFLRELISNASDAVDKLYFKSLTDTDVQIGKDDLSILVAFDKDTRTLTISDNGVGMTEDELEKDLGTIAHSGSLEFSEGLDEDAADKDIDIIGQFGVGFYSAFMVASKVEVVSKAYGADKAYRWESDGVEGYTISETERESQGTDVILSIKENAADENYDKFLSEDELQSIIKRYSNYVRYPIKMMCTEERELPKPEDAGDDYTPQYEEYKELETINSMIPIWKRKNSEVTQEEYNDFYKSDFHDYTDPVRTFSIHAEGQLTYDALLFIPSRPPYDFYNKNFEKGLALYSSNVLIMEKCDELLPDCFNFVRGVVDSEDLSLNISRETLQHNGQLHAIARRVEKKIKSELSEFLESDREGYEKFFKDFGGSMKYGIYSSYGIQKDLLADLLVFYSAKQKKMITLDEYIEGMDEYQTAIYYAAGDSLDRLAKMPVVTSVLDRKYDVLLCTDRVDDFCMVAMRNYKEKDLKNVASGDLGLETATEKDAAELAAKENEGLFAKMKEALGDKVSKVTTSALLTESPVCLTAEGPVSLEMEKVLSTSPGNEDVKSERVLEINAKHPIFETLKSAYEAGDEDKVKLYTDVLYNQALLVEGMKIDDPVAYAQEICELMK